MQVTTWIELNVITQILRQISDAQAYVEYPKSELQQNHYLLNHY